MPDRRSPAAAETSDLLTTWESGPEPDPAGVPRPTGARDPSLAGGRYVVQEEIARGGMGRVVAATDLVLGRTVAVKEALTTDPDTVRRFVRETEITALLEHPAIVPVYDAGVDAEGMPYYVMRKVSGKPLERLVDATKTLAERLALLPHVVSAAQAVAHAHRRAVLHRDLKPSNILVGEFGETVVIDWGLAKVADATDDPHVDPLPSGPHVLTQVGAVFGTPGYMSPEQVAGAPVDARSDVYALGATLYFLLAKRAPHHGDSVEAIMALAAAGPPPPIAELVPGVPRDLAWIVDTALAFDPERRFPDAGALAAELKNFTTGQLVASRHYTRRERLVRFVRRHRIAVTVALAAAIALGIAASSVVAARARAEEALAKSRHQERLKQDALDARTLDQARALLASNPTAAVVVARSLAETAHWREVRAIGAAARYTGACIGLPGPLVPTTIAFAPGGRLATTSDQSGAVWLHDLDRRTSRQVAQLRARAAHASFAGDDRLVLFDTQRLAVLELASGATRELRGDLDIRTAAATRTAVFVVTHAGRVHRVPLDGAGSTQLDVETAHSVAPSPDERWLAVATGHGLALFDLVRGGPPVRIAEAFVVDARWDPSSKALSAHVQANDDEILLVEVDPALAIAARRHAGQGVTHLVRGGHLVTLDQQGDFQGVGFGPVLKAASWSDFPLALVHGDTVVVGRQGGLITLLNRGIGIELHAPSDNLQRLAASPAGPYVVAATPGRLLVWNTDEILPTLKQVPSASQYYMVGRRRLLLAGVLGNWIWYDLESGSQKTFKLPPEPLRPLTDGSGELVVLTHDTQLGGRGFLIARYGQPVEEVENDPSAIGVVDGKVVVGTPEGEVIELDPASRRSAVLAARSGRAVVSLGDHGRWRSARWTDGAVWRRSPDGREEWGTFVQGPSMLPLLIQQPDGRVCTAAGRRIDCWEVDGSTRLLATLPMEITWVERLTDEFGIATIADGGLYRFDLATGSARVLGATTGIDPGIASRPGLAVATRADNRIEMIDLVEDATWSLATSFRGANQGAKITPDGELVTVLSNGQDLWLWELHFPQTPEATARWLDRLTNATDESGTARVGWR